MFFSEKKRTRLPRSTWLVYINVCFPDPAFHERARAHPRPWMGPGPFIWPWALYLGLYLGPGPFIWGFVYRVPAISPFLVAAK